VIARSEFVKRRLAILARREAGPIRLRRTSVGSKAAALLDREASTREAKAA